MKRGSRSPVEDSLVGTILVENVPRRPVTIGEVTSWLKKYGEILEITIYKDCYVVQFESDLEAAGAVQCENGANFFGTPVCVKHAEPGILSALRRTGHPINRFTSSKRRTVPSLASRDRNRDREMDRDRDRDRERNRLRDRERGRTREPDSPSRSRYHEDSPYDRRRRHDDRSPRRRSRSPASRGDRRHVHPLNWLSEMAGTDSGSNKPTRSLSPSVRVARGSSPPPQPPYTVAIVAVQHDLVPYAETIEKRVSTGLRGPGGRELTTPLRTHIVVLLSVEHLTPCLADLTRDLVPFAIICTTTNWSHGSCTLRILYVPTQQEHRNMPLDDAITLLQKEYDTYMALDRVPPIAAAPAPVADENTEEDHTFLAPSRNMVTLLRMLADSRILSIGELDEIAAFVQERKRRLEGRRLDNKSADTRNGTTSDLKTRILSMLYPPTSNSSTASVNAVGQLTSTPNQSSSIPNSTLDANNLQTINRLAGALPNPAIQQALDTLMMLPPGQFPQPVPAPTSASTGLSATASAQSQQQSYGKNSTQNMPQERNSGTMAGSNRMSYGSGPGSVKSGRADMNPMQQRMDDFTRYGGPRPAGDYSATNNTPSGFSTYKQPTQQQQQPMYLNDVKTAQDSRGPAGGLNRRESDEHYQGARNPGSTALRSKDDTYGGPTEEEPPAPTAPSWQRRKRGKRGGTKSNAGNRNASDLSSSSMGPIGTVPDPYSYSWPPGSSSELGAQYPPAAGPHMINDQYPYPNQSYGYNYPPQSYY